MKYRIFALLTLVYALFSTDRAAAQGTAFTYQGQLRDNGNQANGSYDLSFGLFTTASGGNPVVAPVTNSAVSVINGQYSVALDFGPGIFTGTNYWLELSVRAAGTTDFHTLAPRQAVLPEPYSIYAANAGAVAASNITGTIGLGQLPGTLVTSSALSNLNASQLTSGTVADGLLSSNVALLNRNNGFTATVIATNPANKFAGTFNGTVTGSNIVASNFFGNLAGDVTGTQNATVVAKVGGQTAASIATATTTANAATNVNTANTVVRRNAAGNFSAGTITATLAGNATSATTAGNATNFSGSLTGDVTGIQGATVVSKVGGQTAASVASATATANAATSANTPNTIVLRDASGNFSASAITAASLSGDGSAVTNLNASQLASGTVADGLLSTNVALLNGSNNFSNVLTATNGSNQFGGTFNGTVTGSVNAASNFSGGLSGDVTGTQGATVVSSVGGQTAADVASATTAANSATSAGTSGTIVSRDASGNFSAGTITANLSGNATTAGSFTGTLAGDVTGTQGATAVSGIGGQSAANVAAATAAANAATSANTPSTIVQRDASGNFSAGAITAASLSGDGSAVTNLNASQLATGTVADGLLSTNVALLNGSNVFTGPVVITNAASQFNGTLNGTANNFSGNLNGDVTGTQNATAVSSVGGQTAASVATATTAANAATSANTPSAIVQRDASGNFSAGAITATSLSGDGSAVTSLNASQLAAGTVPDGRLSTNVPLLNGSNAFTGSNQFAGPVVLTNAANQFSGTFNGTVIGSGSVATNFSGSLNGDVTGTQGATVVTSVGGQTAANVAGATTAANAAVSANTVNTIVKRDASGNFSAGTISAASFSGIGSSLSNLNATQLTTGTVADVRLSTNVALLNGTNAFSGSNNFSGPVTVTNTANHFNGTLTGNVIGSATSATNFSGSLTGDVTGTQSATVVSTVAGQSAANVAAGSLLANQAASSDTIGALVRRDIFGNFVAGVITASLTGNATSATTATTAGTATNFSGSLVGDVSGTQGATVVAKVGGQTAANVATASVAANAATNVNTASAIVRRDASGNFSAGTVTASFSGNGSAVTSLNASNIATGTLTDARLSTNVPLLNGSNAFSGTNNFTGPVVFTNASNQFAGTFNGIVTGSVTNAINFTGNLNGDVTGTQSATVVATVGGKTAASVASATTAANAATSSGTASTLVMRDASGNFSAGTITATLAGNAATADSANSFSGNLNGDVSGTQGATVVSLVGGQSAASVASATATVGFATSAAAPGTLVQRDGSGNFSAAAITAASLSGDGSALTNLNASNLVSGTVADGLLSTNIPTLNGSNAFSGTNNFNGPVVLNNASNQFAGTFNGTVANSVASATNFTGNLTGDVSGTQGTTVVATVGGQTAANVASGASAANAATSAATPSTIVMRDASGNFSASAITAVSISGNGSALTSLNASNLATGIVADNLLSTNIPRLNGSNVFSGTNNFTGPVVLNNASNQFTGTFNGVVAGAVSNAVNFTGTLTGDVTGTQSATAVSTVGGQTAANVASATIAANNATNANTASRIVQRDASGNFSASLITASNLASAVNVSVAGTNFVNFLVVSNAPTFNATNLTNISASALPTNLLALTSNNAVSLTNVQSTNLNNTNVLPTLVSPMDGLTGWAGTSTAVAATNTLYIVPLVVSWPTYITNVCYAVGTSAASGFVCISIYNSSGNRILDTGPQGTTATKAYSILMTNVSNTVGQTLQPGTYYVGWNCTSTTAKFTTVAGATVYEAVFNAAPSPVYEGTAANTPNSAGDNPATLGTITASSLANILFSVFH